MEVCSQAEDTSGGEDQLPQFFFKALSTVSTLVDAFLGTVTPLGAQGKLSIQTASAELQAIGHPC